MNPSLSRRQKHPLLPPKRVKCKYRGNRPIAHFGKSFIHFRICLYFFVMVFPIRFHFDSFHSFSLSFPSVETIFTMVMRIHAIRKLFSFSVCIHTLCPSPGPKKWITIFSLGRSIWIEIDVFRQFGCFVFLQFNYYF